MPNQDLSLPLSPTEAYHIFNRDIIKQAIFFKEGNYDYFLQKYNQYMRGYWRTYAWALMDNHFHLVVKLRDAGDIAEQAIQDFV